MRLRRCKWPAVFLIGAMPGPALTLEDLFPPSEKARPWGGPFLLQDKTQKKKKSLLVKGAAEGTPLAGVV